MRNVAGAAGVEGYHTSQNKNIQTSRDASLHVKLLGNGNYRKLHHVTKRFPEVQQVEFIYFSLDLMLALNIASPLASHSSTFLSFFLEIIKSSFNISMDDRSDHCSLNSPVASYIHKQFRKFE